VGISFSAIQTFLNEKTPCSRKKKKSDVLKNNR
jgi:hypothetical protein